MEPQRLFPTHAVVSEWGRASGTCGTAGMTSILWTPLVVPRVQVLSLLLILRFVRVTLPFAMVEI
jgi:hypothetical protein